MLILVLVLISFGVQFYSAVAATRDEDDLERVLRMAENDLCLLVDKKGKNSIGRVTADNACSSAFDAYFRLRESGFIPPEVIGTRCNYLSRKSIRCIRMWGKRRCAAKVSRQNSWRNEGSFEVRTTRYLADCVAGFLEWRNANVVRSRPVYRHQSRLPPGRPPSPPFADDGKAVKKQEKKKSFKAWLSFHL